MSKDIYNVTDLAAPMDVNFDIKMLMLPMRDGVKLHTSVFFPPGLTGPAPVVITRSPYTRTTWFALPYAPALERKCIYIGQACRGTGWSEGGVFHPSDYDTEKNDFADLLEWLKQQEWFDGRCAMLGASYPGWVQWAAARNADPALVAISPRVAPIYGCCGFPRTGGGNSWSFMNWALSMYHRRTYGYADVPDYRKLGVHWHLPANEGDRFAGYGDPLPVFQDLLKPGTVPPGPFLRRHESWFPQLITPAFIQGGWFDGFKPETVASFRLLKHRGASAEARNFTRLTIGPWVHGGLDNPELFGAENDLSEMQKWEEKFLFGLLNDPHSDPLPGEPAVRYFMLGENRWHDASDWPPPGAAAKTFYLHSDGKANTDGGSISEASPGEEPPDRYTSDPNHPVSPWDVLPTDAMLYDRSSLEKREDMLVYTSAKFTEPLTVAGDLRLNFYASAGTVDTDFFATLTDVTPDGRSLILTRGMVRARYRNTLDKAELLTPGEVCRYELDLGDVAVKFLPGHAMRLEICGQEFPEFERNANTGNPAYSDRELLTSVHTVFHDATRPAELILPVLP